MWSFALFLEYFLSYSPTLNDTARRIEVLRDALFSVHHARALCHTEGRRTFFYLPAEPRVHKMLTER